MGEKDLFTKFIGRHGTLHWKNGFALYGEITDCSDDFIIFETTEKRSLITKDQIKDFIEE
jgi:hypothetical protein